MIYTDEQGKTRLGEADVADREASLGPPPNPTGTLADLGAVTTMVVFSAPAGTEVPAHNAPQPYIAILLSGEGEVVTSAGETRRLRPGDLILCNDLTGKGHVTRAITDIVAVFVNRASS
jgi:quercetin dioxygenase-like cupin family protein